MDRKYFEERFGRPIPDKFKWVAIDSNGQVWSYVEQPVDSWVGWLAADYFMSEDEHYQPERLGDAPDLANKIFEI